MRQIHDYAHCTIIWLGPASNNSDLAMNFIVELWHLMNSDKWRHDAKDLEVLLSDYPLDAPEWIALARLLRHAWFCRVWVLQEVAVSKSLVIQHGDKPVL
jgi:hypothetical protein